MSINPNADVSTFLTDEEHERLILALMGDGDAGVSEEHIGRWLRWCEEAELRHALVRGVLGGQVAVFWPEGSDESDFPAFKSTDALFRKVAPTDA